LCLARQAPVLQAIVADDEVHLGLPLQQCPRCRGPVAPDLHRGARSQV